MSDLFETRRRKISWCPVEQNAVIDWNEIEAENSAWIDPMRQTLQDTAWHGEGNAWTHTRMVCESLVVSDDWKMCSEQERFVLFLAALLHDVGKPECTKIEDGHVVSPNHAPRGSQIARRFLYETLGMAGSPECFRLRELIVSLIRRHTLPYNILKSKNAVRDIVMVSTVLSCRLLATLSKADINGRIFDDKNQKLECVELFCQLAEENDCLDRSYSFHSNHSRYAWFSGTLSHPGEMLFDDTWGEVVLMSGLPATGKDTYIERHVADRPVISLDSLRRQMNISWNDDQTQVVEAAREKAKKFLRSKTSFVWNATNLRYDFRRSLIRLCTNYQAAVRIVYLENDLPTLIQRNRTRPHPVAESAYNTLLDRWEIPTVLESHELTMPRNDYP